MFPELFSKRHGLRPTPEGLMYEEVSKTARVGLYHIVEQFFESEHIDKYLALYKIICLALRIAHDREVWDDYQASIAIEKLIMNCGWWQFYDICEVMWHALDSKYRRDRLSAQVNTLFAEEHLGFELREGLIEKVGIAFIDAYIKEARYLLKEPEFKGADYLFEKALKAINIRPNADVENCIKDAVAAIEAVGKIIVNDDKASLDDIMKGMANKKVIPKPLDDAIRKIYAYRGSQPGVAHGSIRASEATIDEAEFVLAMSAAIIIYLVKKREKI